MFPCLVSSELITIIIILIPQLCLIIHLLLLNNNNNHSSFNPHTTLTECAESAAHTTPSKGKRGDLLPLSF